MGVLHSVILCEIVCNLTYGLYVLSPAAKSMKKRLQNECETGLPERTKKVKFYYVWPTGLRDMYV